MPDGDEKHRSKTFVKQIHSKPTQCDEDIPIPWPPCQIGTKRTTCKLMDSAESWVVEHQIGASCCDTTFTTTTCTGT